MKTKRYGKGYVTLWYPCRFRRKPRVYIFNSPSYSNPLAISWQLCFWWLSFQIGILFVFDPKETKTVYDIQGEIK